MKRWILTAVCAMLVLGLCANALAAPHQEELDRMLPALDSVLRASSVEGNAYDPNDPECVWTVLYLMGVNWGEISPDILYDEPIVVPESVMKRFARAAFAELNELPAIPDDLSASVRFDDAQKAYLLAGSDAGETSVKIEGVITGSDGPTAVVIGMYGGDDERNGGMTVTLVPNDDALFPYAIQSATAE